MKEALIVIGIVVSYVLAAGTTYGYAYHDLRCYNADAGWCHYNKTSQAAMNAMFWPVYWPGHIARKAMEP